MEISKMDSKRKTSLFAQRMMNKKKDHKTKEEDSIQTFNLFGEKSFVVSGHDAETIHKENMIKLATMSREDIEEERTKLLTEMDPALVEFLRSKKLKQRVETAKPSSNQVNQKVNIPKRKNVINSTVINTSGCDTTPIVGLVNKWPNMDVVEHEKLQWMEKLPPPKPPPLDVPYNARFSFDGTLLPYVEDIPQDGLYHHGEEPQRPGYTLQELIQLSRSTVLQQRVTSLNTLANIFQKASDYNYCLEKPLLPQLLESEIFLLLRFTLDDSVRQVITAAVAAICNLFVNFADESCLERLLGLGTGLRQPLFYVKMDLKVEDIAELKDPQLLKLDVIKGALRTHLLPRFSYILKNLKSEPVEAVNMVKCLTRIARHSFEAALDVANCPGLLHAVRSLLNKENVFNYSEALKLFRVIACHSSNLAEQLVQNYMLLEPIQRYISGEQRDGLMSLVLESFYTWQTLLSYNLTTDVFLGFSPIVQRLLLAHAENTTLTSSGADQEHATALISTLSVALRVDYNSSKQYLPTLELCALKWLSQISVASNITWTTCKLLGAVLNCAAVVIVNGESNSKDVTIKVLKFLDSPNFMYCSNNLRKSSWLLFDYQDNKVENLPCLGIVSPTVYDTSTLPVIVGLVTYLQTLGDLKLSEKFVSSSGIQNYLQEIIKGNIQSRTGHWYARQEIFLLYSILHVHLHIMSETEDNFVHEVALILASAIQTDDRYLLSELFEKIIFNPQFFRTDMSGIVSQFQSLQLKDSCQTDDTIATSLLSVAIESLDTISSCYLSILGLQSLTITTPPLTLTSSTKGVEPALPTDWQFIPILQLYNSEGCGEDGISTALSSLQWVLILEMLRPKIASATSVSARYCRLACTFLAGNDLFRDVTSWLQTILVVLLQYNSQLDFDEPIPGLTSFYDFFRQLMEQFSAVSYSNPVFGQYLLVPLQQRHNSKYRKIIWSEQAGILRILSTPVNQLGVPLKEFLEPCETDNDLLYIYLGCLATGRVQEIWCPVLYKVAVHHVATFVKHYADQPFAKSLLHKIQSLGNQQLRTLLLEYSYSEDV